MSVIALEGAARRFDERTGVGPVDFTTDHAEFISIVGPSGCGKSVLVDMIGGLEHCDGGSIAIDGVRVHGPSPDRQIVFQDGALFPWLTVEENVAFGLRARGDRPDDIDNSVDAILQTVQLERVAHLYPRELAASMRQRTAIARALVLRPPVLLLDDPFAALDEVSRARMQLELAQLWSSTRATAVLVTHSVPEACLLADRVVVLSHGPGRIAGVFTIEGSRPRTTADVAQRVDEIGELLRAQAAAGGAAESESLAGTLVYRSPRRRLG
jgi:ABC-type nitrate/sulfonate/bicarbonate transport system ATPase subunit